MPYMHLKLRIRFKVQIMATFALDTPAFALLKGWEVDKDKADMLISQNLRPVLHAIRNVESPTILGRLPETASSDPTSPVPDNFFHLTPLKSISRQHASIRWDSDRSQWMLRCLSKNGLFLNTKVVKPEDRDVELPDRASLKIGPVYFYFVLPIESGSSGSSPISPSAQRRPPPIAAPSLANVATVPAAAGAAAAAAPLPGESSKPESGGARGKYAIMIQQAFDRAAAADGKDVLSVSLAKQEIISFCIAENPELSDPSKRKLLMKSIGDQLNRHAIKNETSKNWTLPSDFLGTRVASSSGIRSPGLGSPRMSGTRSPPSEKKVPAKRAASTERDGGGEKSFRSSPQEFSSIAQQQDDIDDLI
jgi:pSer/pThr/pTyr-binding forkhead associated (FHA) protein